MTGNVSAGGGVFGNLAIAGNLSATDIIATGNVGATNITATGNVAGRGLATFGNVIVTGPLVVMGNLQASNVGTGTVTAGLVSATVATAGMAIADNLIGNVVTANGNLFAARANVTGNVSAGGGVFGNLAITGNLTVGGTPLSTLISAAATSTTGTLTVGNLAVGGDVLVAGNLGVATLVASVLSVEAGGGGALTTTTSARVRVSTMLNNSGVLAYGDGTVWATGDDNFWKIGNLANVTVYESSGRIFQWAKALGIQNVVQTAIGNRGSIALCSDGSVWAVGWDPTGVPAIDAITHDQSSSPVQILSGGAVFVAASHLPSYGIVMADGTILLWGNAPLGDPSRYNSIISAAWQPPNVRNAIQIAFASTPAVLLADGTVLTMDPSSHSFQPTLSHAVQISGSDNGLVVVFANGAVQSAIASSAAATITNAVQAACGSNHVIVLRSDSTVVSFGTNNSYGQLGIGTYASATTTPQPVLGVAGRPIAVSAGYNHSMVYTDSGDVYVAGDNSFGQLGVSSTSVPNSNVFVVTGPVHFFLVTASPIRTSRYWKSRKRPARDRKCARPSRPRPVANRKSWRRWRFGCPPEGGVLPQPPSPPRQPCQSRRWSRSRTGS